MAFTVKPAKRLAGSIVLPGDKSISHRAIMLASIANGTSKIRNILHSDDTEVTIDALHELGIDIKVDSNEITVLGKGLLGLTEPSEELNMRASGTSMRILMGILSGQPFKSILTADEGLSKRPMKRVTEPLTLMGAKIEGKDNANYAPITIQGGKLKSIQYYSRIASAQVKSAVLLAGLYAEGTTSYSEPSKSRDHTERMLTACGAQVSVDGLKISIRGKTNLKPQNIDVPGDISSGAFFIVAAALIKGSSITLKSVGINPTRAGIIDILRRMGANVRVENVRRVMSEPLAEMIIESSPLRGITIESYEIPRAIDELPVLMVAAALASGRTVIKGAQELKVKETDRINSMSTNLNKMGAKFSVQGNDIIIEGAKSLKGIQAETFGDHRTAMSLVVAGLAAEGETIIDNIECISKSYPDFTKHLQSLLA